MNSSSYYSLLIILVLLLTSCHAISQSPIDPSWTKIERSMVGDAEAWGITVNESGEVYWAVSSEVDDLGLDIKCYKLSSEGTELWPEPLLVEGDGTQQAFIVTTDDTNLYIGGRNCPRLIQSCDMMLIKVDQSSKLVEWTRTKNFDANGYDEIDAISIEEDGIYCGGWAQQFESAPFHIDMGLWKLDFDGNTIWTNYLGEPSTAEHLDGHFVVDGDIIYASGLWGGTSISNLYNGHSFLGSFSTADGSLIDSALYGPQSDDFLDIENALGMATDGEFIYMTGYTTPSGPDDWQIFLAKYDKDLNELWYVDWGGSGTESARGITLANDRIYIAGLTESKSLMSNDVSREGLFVVFNTNGDFINYQTWSLEDATTFHDLYVKDKIYITGTSEVNSRKVGFLLTLEDITTSVEDLQLEGRVSIYPNPSSGKIIIDINEYKNDLLCSIVNQNGIVLESKMFIGDEISFNVKNAGVYFIRFSNDQFSISKKVIIH